MRRFGRVHMWLVEPRRTHAWRIGVFEFKVVVARHVTRLLRALDLFKEFIDDNFLNHLAAQRVDGMRDISVQLRAPVRILRSAGIRESLATLVAVLGS